MKAGDDQEGIGLDEKKERVGKFLRWRLTEGFARKRRPKPGASASYQSCASMSSARAVSVRRIGHTKRISLTSGLPVITRVSVDYRRL